MITTLTLLPLPKVPSYIYKTTFYNIIHEYHIPSDGFVFSRGHTHHRNETIRDLPARTRILTDRIQHFTTQQNIYDAEKENCKLTALMKRLTLCRMANLYESNIRKPTI